MLLDKVNNISMLVMRRILFFVLLPVISFSHNSCKNLSLKSDYREFVNSEIILPDSLCLVHDDQVLTVSPDIARPTLIIFIDSTSCTSCQISHLNEFEKLFDLSAGSELFDMMILFSPKTEETSKLIKDILLSVIEYDIYVDSNSEFMLYNEQIPSDERFHIFLINKEKKPIFVGNPLATEELWKIFLKRITTN